MTILKECDEFPIVFNRKNRAKARLKFIFFRITFYLDSKKKYFIKYHKFHSQVRETLIVPHLGRFDVRLI